MGKIGEKRVARMAEGVAEGLTLKEAAVAAGYSPRTNSINKIAATTAFTDQVEAARLRRRRRGGSPDLGR